MSMVQTTGEAISPSPDLLILCLTRARHVLAFAGLGLLALIGTAGTARAEPFPGAAVQTLVTPSEMKTGALLVKTQKGYIEATRLKTDIDVEVSGPTARARITQEFRNPTDHWIEGVYVYPLPEGGAVDTMKMVIGTRVIVADIAERQKARAVYEAARAAGQTAALTEQQRPNIFTNSVANIGPGESVVVQVEYQEPVHQSGGQFSLRVPLVVAPRYNPAPVAQQADFSQDGSGWGRSDPVPDRAAIDPPVRDPRAGATGNDVTLAVHLDAGFPVGDVRSATHAVKIDAPSADTRTVTLEDAVVPADRDFELTWRPTPSKTPSVGLFREHVGPDDYLLAFVTPPVLQGAAKPQPRDVTFVIDNSGSMEGTSIRGAKASLLYGLDHLHPGDRFNVIRFDDTMTELFPETVPADDAHLAQARSFVASLEARGGTEMLPPMTAALTDDHPAETDRLRQVIFLTDGEIGNEQQIFDTIARMRGRSRLFMVGIGSAPNGYLMTRAAEIGRGSYTAIPTVDLVQERMQALVQKLESPAVTDLAATFSVPGADMTPAVLPDLYRGEPLILAAKLGGPGGTLDITGKIGDAPWHVTLPVEKAATGAGLSKVWARRKIDDAEVARTMGRISQGEADRVVLGLALDHHLVTRLTSLVAVDRTPHRPAGVPLTRADVPLDLPAGWDFDRVFGPDGETHDRPRLDHADLATDKLAEAAPVQGIVLPKTATDAELRLIAGLLLLGASLLCLALDNACRRRAA